LYVVIEFDIIYPVLNYVGIKSAEPSTVRFLFYGCVFSVVRPIKSTFCRGLGFGMNMSPRLVGRDLGEDIHEHFPL